MIRKSLLPLLPLLFVTVTHAEPQGAPPTPQTKVADQPIVSAATGTQSIDRYVVAGGGGTSTAGSFRLEGTVGQAVAGGSISGASYTVNSGFWVPETTSVPAKKRGGQITSQ